ncbi:unnamed protein product [Phytomonas sp. Hart1]|nr:unnamed protein product [Phytomonas sp. Hart1]|eukprot:CCW67551.1 unnamed protein product [Phytomonas sp. isolate Hart1]
MAAPCRQSSVVSFCGDHGELDGRSPPIRDLSKSSTSTLSTPKGKVKIPHEHSKSSSCTQQPLDTLSQHQQQRHPDGKTLSASTSLVAPAMLANPLSMQATVLRTPDFFVNPMPSGDDLVEEGDILYDVLKDSRFETDEPDDVVREDARVKATPMQPLGWLSPIAGIGVQPVLTLPNKVGKYLANEHLKALICFVNGAVYPLHNLRLRIDVILPPEALTGASGFPHSAPSPPQSARRSLIHQTCPEMKAKSTKDYTVDVLLSTAGTYVLDVNVLYVDPSGEARKLNWSSSFGVESALTEVSRRVLRRLKLPDGRPRTPPVDFTTPGALFSRPPTPAEALGNLRLPLHTYIFSVGLQNTSGVPLTLCRLQMLAATTTDGEGAPSPVKLLNAAPSIEVGGKAGARSTAPSSVFLQPGERVHCSFEFLILNEALCNLLIVHNASTGVSSPLLKPPLNGPLGAIEWEWRRWNGDGGTARSAPLFLGQLRGLPLMELVVVRVRSLPSDPRGVWGYGEEGAPGSEGASSDIHRVEHCAHPDEVPLKAGQPVEFELCIVHYGNHTSSDGEAPVEVALKVRPEKLAPYWLYTGAIPRYIGHVEPNHTCTFKLKLLPWHSGWVPLPRDGLEIVDAHSPGHVLAPLPPVVIESASTAVVSSSRRESEKQSSILTSSLVKPGPIGLAQKKIPTALVVGRNLNPKASGEAAGLCVEEDQNDSVLCEVLVL